MTAPSTLLRQLREVAALRRLEISKMLREDPTLTNVMLAKALKVSRNTITSDRKIMVDDLTKQTRSETEELRSAMVHKLESLNKELELHRRDGKLPTAVVHEMLLVHRSIIELLGIRKPVTEKLEIKKRTVSFTTSVISADGKQSAPKLFEIEHKQLALNDGDHDEPR